MRRLFVHHHRSPWRIMLGKGEAWSQSYKKESPVSVGVGTGVGTLLSVTLDRHRVELFRFNLD